VYNNVELPFSSTPTPSFLNFVKCSWGKSSELHNTLYVITGERLAVLMSHKSHLQPACTHAMFSHIDRPIELFSLEL